MRLKNMSLKTKMALAVSLLFVTYATIMAFFSIRYYEREYKESMARQQYDLISCFADNLDDKLGILSRTLTSNAKKVSLQELQNADLAQNFLDNRYTLSEHFKNGICLLTPEGRLIAESPFRANRRGRDVSLREFYRKTIETGKPYISSPYTSTHNPGQPAIMLTAPVLDGRGELIGILCGSINVLGQSVLQGMTPLTIGETGSIYISDRKRNIMIHADPAKVMKQGPPPGVSAMFDRAIEGFQGSGEALDAKGERTLVSARQLRTADWIVLADYPLSEAYAPLKNIKLYFISAIGIGMLAFLLLVWQLMKRLTQPLLELTRHVESLPEKTGVQKLVDLDSSDELGTLAKAFNNMVLELQLREESLRESEQLYRSIFQDSHAVMLLLDSVTAEIVDVNTAACLFYGYSREDMINRKIAEINTHSSSEMHLNFDHAARDEQHNFNVRHSTANGRIHDVEVYCGPVRVKGKTLLLSIVHDITARREAEEAFRSSHKLLETTLASLKEAVFIVDTVSTLINDCNPAALKMFGYNRKALIGRSTSCLHVTEENGLWFHGEMLKGYEGKGFFEAHIQMRRADGTTFQSEHFVTPIRDSEGKVMSEVWVVRDITDQKQVEAEYRRLNDLLEQRVIERTSELVASNQELESFCYSVSHDLRSPLRGIDGFCSILKEEYADKLDEEGRDYLQRISSAAVRMGQLIDDLLNLSRVTRSELVYDMVDLSQLVLLIMNDFQQLDPGRRVELELIDGAMAKADRRLIRVVLENLLGNAWKFSKNRPVTKIEFGIGESDGEAFYFISDNGVGFDMMYAPKLFKPFQRLHSMTEFAGTGIGLASVQRIINRHGGRTWVESAVDKGTTFYFTLTE